MPSCKGVCDRPLYLAPKPGRLGSRYRDAKRCTLCDKWIRKKFVKCPCCKRQLKTSPNYVEGKEKLLVRKRI